MKQVGILGLPGSGKTTLFEILLQGAGAAGAAGGREQLGIVQVPDPRLEPLTALFRPKQTVHTRIQFVDSAAPGRPGSQAPKGSDRFASVRNCDALAVVVRDFENPAVPAPGGVDPERDARAVEAELILNDLAIVETRLERIEKELRVGKKAGERERALLVRCRELLESAHPLRDEPLDAEGERLVRGFQFLSRKPRLVVYNRGEHEGPAVPEAGPGSLAVALSAHLEREILALPPAERAPFRAELKIEHEGLTLMIRACYQLLGLISFFTVGPDEVRAWPLRRGERAVDAAGEIHSDLARGFIRAEVVGWSDLLAAGGIAGARARGLLRLEGRDYVVQDGDCLEIRFST